jgi:DNA-binding NarL/FixJ family response regulator
LRSDLRVIVGHRNAHVRAGLLQLLVEEGHAEAVKEAVNNEELVAALKERKWSVVVLGTPFVDSGVKEFLEALRKVDPEIKCVVLSSYPHAAVSALLLNCGADAVVMEEKIDEELLSSINKLRRGEYVDGRGHEEDSLRLGVAVGEKPPRSALSSTDRTH